MSDHLHDNSRVHADSGNRGSADDSAAASRAAPRDDACIDARGSACDSADKLLLRNSRRPIRSYVRRAGRLTASQRRALAEHWHAYGMECGDEPLDFAAVFGRRAAIVLEIGFGNGETLVQQAAAAPECDFVGIEVHEPGVGHCLMKAREAAVGNLRLLMHDAVEVLERWIPARSLARVNLYFPDPWPKKRHHKRRLMQLTFADLLAARLQPGGSLHIATDWEHYADHIAAVLAASADFALAEQRVHAGERPLHRPQTKFERRGARHGHRIWDWRFERRGG